MTDLEKSRADTDTYIRDVVYPSGYHAVQNPLNLQLVAAINRYAINHGADRFNYCDLGCGNGVTLNLLADMYPDARFVGVDFNPAHIDEARRVAGKSGLENVEYHELSFDDLGNLDAGEHDFITCIGTYSWVSSAHRDAIDRYVARTLNNNGMFLVHYAAKPGKVQIDPLWHFIRVMTEQVKGDSVARARAGARMLRQLHSRNAAFFRLNPVAAHREQQISGQNVNYLSHEALTEWQALNHADVAASMNDKDLFFLGHAQPVENIHKFSVPRDFRADFDAITDARARETWLDYVVNRGLRWDIYSRGTEKNDQGCRDVLLGLLTSAVRIPKTIRLPDNHQYKINSDIAIAIVEQLQTGALSYRKVVEAERMSIYEDAGVIDTLDALIATHVVMPVREQQKKITMTTSSVKPATPLTELLLSSALEQGRGCFLPAPLTGHAVFYNILTLMMMHYACITGTDSDAGGFPEHAKQAGLNRVTGGETEKLTPDNLKTAYDHFRQNLLPRLVNIGVLACVDV